MSEDQLSEYFMNNPENKKKVLDLMKVCADCMIRISGERNLIKESVKRVSEDLDIPKKVLNKMIKTYYNNNFEEEVEEQYQFERLYTSAVSE